MARTSKGTLYQRKSSYGNVLQTWWLEYFVNGQRVRESLDPKDKKEAEKKRKERMAALQTGNEAARLRAVVRRLQDTEADHTAAGASANDRHVS